MVVSHLCLRRPARRAQCRMPALYASAERIDRELSDTHLPKIHDAVALPLHVPSFWPPMKPARHPTALRTSKLLRDAGIDTPRRRVWPANAHQRRGSRCNRVHGCGDRQVHRVSWQRKWPSRRRRRKWRQSRERNPEKNPDCIDLSYHVRRQIALFELDRDSPPQAVCGHREDQRKRCGFLEINGKTVHFLTRPHREYSR